MYYTASSVIAALKASSRCTGDGLEKVKCPKDGCMFSPNNCTLNNQKCSQSVTIYDKNNNPVILHFTFPISDVNHDGYINKNSTSLARLFIKNIINITSLVPATMPSNGGV